LVDGFEKVAEGAYCEIWFAPRALKIYNKAPVNDRARMGKVLDHLSEYGPQDLNDKQFKPEGRYPCSGGGVAMVYAAKSYQLRVYGCWQSKPTRRLVCPESAIKKDNKADQKQLQRVAKKVGE
jgi:hypothetical protein